LIIEGGYNGIDIVIFMIVGVIPIIVMGVFICMENKTN